MFSYDARIGVNAMCAGDVSRREELWITVGVSSWRTVDHSIDIRATVASHIMHCVVWSVCGTLWMWWDYRSLRMSGV